MASGYIMKGGSDSSSDINYNNTTSGMTATNVQDAIDEVAGNMITGDITEIKLVNSLPADAAQHPTVLYLIQENV